MNDILNMDKWRFRLPTFAELKSMVEEAMRIGARQGLARNGCGGGYLGGLRLCGDADDRLTLCWNADQLDLIHEHAFENYDRNDRYWDFYGRLSWKDEEAMTLMRRIVTYCQH